MKNFKEYKNCDLAQTAKDILAQWEQEDLFKQSLVRKGPNAKDFIFFEFELFFFSR